MTDKQPGWDAQAIQRIAIQIYGNYQTMFDHHGWPERGSEMFGAIQRRVVEEYGSVEAFVEHHKKRAAL